MPLARSNPWRIAVGAAILAVVILCVGSYMALGRSEVLEFDQVTLFKMEKDPATNVPVSIAGLCGRSAYSVYDISSTTEGGTTLVIAKIHVARGNESGRFFYKLDLPADVNELRFGDNKHLLWKRG